MRYKVGDKVYLRDDLEQNKDYGNLVWLNEMKRGALVTIERECVLAADYEIENGEGYGYNDEMIDHEKTAQLNWENSMKYKIGDKVYLRNDLKHNELYDNYFWYNTMLENQLVTIEGFNSYTRNNRGYKILEENEKLTTYTDAMIDHERTKRLNKEVENNMRYKADDKIILLSGEQRAIKYIDKDSNYPYVISENWQVGDCSIDHEKTKELNNKNFKWSLTICGESEEFHYKFDDLDEALGFIKFNEEHSDSVKDYVLSKMQ